MDGDFGAISDISVVTALRVRKGLCSGHENSVMVAHRALLLEGTSLRQQVSLLPQMATGAWWPLEAEVLAQTSVAS